jgi:hypothetical protein
MPAMRKPTLLLVCLCAALAAGCGDNEMRGDDDDDGVTPDANIPPDAEIGPDAMVCPAPVAGLVGSPCDQHTDCDSAPGAADGYCFFGTQGPNTYPPEGYCVRDDFTGAVCATDADCGDGGQCISTPGIPGFPDGYKWCLPTCGCAGSDPDVCPPHQACFDNFIFVLDKPSCVPGSATAVDGDACAGIYQCNENSQCFNDFENPGGNCQTTACTVGTDSTCHGGTCVELDDYPAPGTPLCVDTCTTDSDCREAEGYQCFTPDGGGASYCRHPHAGDPCTVAADCGGGVWECLTGNGFTNGYCTQAGCPTAGSLEGCTIFSICTANGAENICADRCDPAVVPDTCREGYSCQPLSLENGGACMPDVI